MIHTVDFFPPVVDDPYEFGQVAAANSLSDVYAMGGKPISALNLLTVPNCLDLGIIREILRGGNDKVLEAGINISGGHSIEDQEPKYGLSVLGLVSESNMLPNGGAQVGDQLVLTKPLGTGILTTADKVDLLTSEQHRALVDCMAGLNRKAAEIVEHFHPHACTDVTGFGLIGHGAEMADGAELTLCLYSRELPYLDGAIQLAKDGIIPGGAYRNRSYLGERFRKEASVEEVWADLAFDPQTSGGLLYALPPEEAQAYADEARSQGQEAWLIGEFAEKEEQSVILLSSR